MNTLRYVARSVLRFVILWAVDTVSLLIAARLLPGLSIQPEGTESTLVVAAAAALVLSIVNLVIRPLILLLALPLGVVVVLVAGFFVNAVVLMITSNLLPSFVVSNWLAAIIGGLVFAAINTIITGVLTIDDDDSFYQGIVERLAKRQSFKGAAEPGRGLIMLEIDGLSYQNIQKALDEGYMPTLAEMVRDEGYVATRVDCGLPSQTSACQAGILFGNNYDIPAFRWYDRDLKKLMVSSTDAPLLNTRYSNGTGLLRGGSSINNMLNGDAEKSLLTIADLKTGTPEDKARRAQDMYLLMLNPYFFTRALVLFFGDVLLELWQNLRQGMRKDEPRMNRLERGYPFLRAAVNVLAREIQLYLIVLDIVRGTPSLYTTFVGYDEVAHHSGPGTGDAMGTLRGFDKMVSRIRDVIERKAPRPYEIIILSDHGQSFGWTFKQRYNKEVKELIEEHLPSGTSVARAMGGDNGAVGVAAMAGELNNIQQQGVGGRTGRAVVGQAGDLLTQGIEQRESDAATTAATVTVCGSGNLAQVYFDIFPRRVTLDELNTTYPGLVDALVRHEGIGFVVAYGDDGTPTVFGKGGTRDLHAGTVTGEDPLAPYGDVTLRAEQVRRVADYPHAGDLILNSTIYADGTVAALEELIGNHGGLGGEQTDSFIFHPSDMVVPEIRNAADLFPVLDARRGRPAAPPTPKEAPEAPVDAWAFSTLARGLGDVKTWLGRAARAVALDRKAFAEVAGDPYATGPAVLIAVVGSILAVMTRTAIPPAYGVLGRVLGWLVAVLAAWGAARLLGGRASFTRTLRVMGFAQGAYVFELLSFIPPFAPFARLVSVVLAFFGMWIGVQQAHRLPGWRIVLAPILAILVLVLSVAIVGTLVAGTQLALTTLAAELGVVPP